MLEDISMSFDEMLGEVEVAERGKKDERGFCESIQLVNYDRKKEAGVLSLSVTLDEPNGGTIQMSAHHIENEETERAFHAVLKARLNWTDITHLRNFLDLLAKFEGVR